MAPPIASSSGLVSMRSVRRSMRSSAQPTPSHTKLDIDEAINWTALNEQGYVVLSKLALKYITTTTLSDIHKSNTFVHDLSNGSTQTEETSGDTRNGGRWQMPLCLKSPGECQLHSGVMALLGRLFPKRTFSTLLILGARKGCKEQDPHTDFEPDDFTIDAADPPFSVMICVQKGSSLVVYDGSHQWVRDAELVERSGIRLRRTRQPRQRTILNLVPGDVVIWNGGLVHSGAGYKVANLRLFNYILPHGYVQATDTNGALVYSTYPVEFVDDSSTGNIPFVSSDDLSSISPSGGTRSSMRSGHPLPIVDMEQLRDKGYLMIDNFVSLPVSSFERLECSLTEHNLRLFAPPEAELFNQDFAGSTTYENDGRRRAASLESWKDAAYLDVDALTAISTLSEAVNRVVQALPVGYTAPELMVLRSDATCLQQAAHTDYSTAHRDFLVPATAPLSLLAGISTESKLVLWFHGVNGQLQPQDVALPRGHAILFHGAQPHSGAGYTRVNFRLFGYLQRPTYVESPRQTHKL